MGVNELFPKPTVKQVIFQIRFPNLFYMESKIGDFQVQVMDEFPNTQLLIEREIQIARTILRPEEVLDKDTPGLRKIWRFESLNGTTLNVKNDSLDLSSQHHKSYNHGDAEYRFRDAIEKVLNAFHATVRIPVINRVGLRYIDKCPLKERTNEELSRCYNTSLNFSQFPIEQSTEIQHLVRTAKGDSFLRLLEKLETDGDRTHLLIDADAYRERIDSSNTLEVTDNLHGILSDAFESIIKEPIKQYMRTGVL